MKIIFKLTLLIITLLFIRFVFAGQLLILGAGSTFAYPIYSKWAQEYQKVSGVKINYQAIGSGAGIKQIQSKTVDFGASDQPLTPDRLEKEGLVQFPTVMGGVVPVININGIKSGELKLTGSVLADIYLGKITKWNDPAIKSLNPTLNLPDQIITVVHRSDGSGTTFIFTNYLSKMSSTWQTKVGSDVSIDWPTGIGGKGNEGVAAYVQNIKGSIGYVEFAYAEQGNLNYVQLQNKAGVFLNPSLKGFMAAAAYADWKSASDFYVILTEQDGKETWPITGATFILLSKVQEHPERAKAVLQFFDWGYRNGKEMALKLNYVPLPENAITLIEKMWQEKIKDKSGNAIWTSPNNA